MALTPTGTLINNFDTEWVGVLQEQTPKFLAGYVDETIRNRIWLAYLRKNGRIMLNGNGPMCIWSIKFTQPPIVSRGDGGGITFNRHQQMRQAALNWRGYIGTDMMTEKEYLMNKGPGQIFDRYGQIIPWLMEALTDKFGGELFIDGNATGNENRIHGIESAMGAGTTISTDLVAQPSDTYAGLSTALGSEISGWSTSLLAAARPNAAVATDWPHGQGPTGYDYNSPIMLNWSANGPGWGTGQATWEANCERAIRQGNIWLTKNGGQAGKPKLCLLSNDLYSGYLNHQAAKQRLIIPHRESEDLGFGEAINQEGLAIMHDYEVPVNTGYFMNVMQMELVSLDSVLFGYRGPDWSIRDLAWLFYTGFWGNGRFRVKHFGKLFNFA